MNTEDLIIRIIEAYGDRAGQWMRISEIATKTGLTRDQLGQAFTALLGDDDFLCDADPLRNRVHELGEAAIAPIIDGEPRHLIMWTR